MFYRHFWGGKTNSAGLECSTDTSQGRKNQFSQVLINVRVDKEGV